MQTLFSMEEAVKADRVVVMEKGRICFEGTPAAVFTQVARLEKLGLDVPLAAKVADRLRRKGMKLPAEILSDEELAVALCR